MSTNKDITTIRQLRITLDEVIQETRKLEQCKETSLVIAHLLDAFVLLGVDLQRLVKQSYLLSKDSSIVSKNEPIVEDLKTLKLSKEDAVNHPSHYTSGGIECIDAMIAAFGVDAVTAFCKCNAFKYQWRAGKKGDTKEDIKKSIWYQNKMLELIDKS